jgi:hypothetical protein
VAVDDDSTDAYSHSMTVAAACRPVDVIVSHTRRPSVTERGDGGAPGRTTCLIVARRRR